jgi:putative flippase GtrA
MSRQTDKPEFVKSDRATLMRSGVHTCLGGLLYVAAFFLFTRFLSPLFRSDLVGFLVSHSLACLPLFFCLFRAEATLSRAANGQLRPAGIYRLRLFLRYAISLTAGGLGIFVLRSLIGAGRPATILLMGAALLFGNLLLSLLSYELLLYLVFGVLTSVVSIGSFSLLNALFEQVLGAGYLSGFGWLLPQTFSFLCAVLFGFVTNRKYVFVSRGNVWQELLTFVGSRLLSTLVLEYGGLFVMANLLRMNEDVAKIIASFLVVAVNYFISKFIIFNRDEKNTDTSEKGESES